MKTILKTITVAVLTATCISSLPVKAQNEERLQPTWWFGISGAANYDYSAGTVPKLPYNFSNGSGFSPYVSAFAEYRPDPVWGLMLNMAFDTHEDVFHNNDAPAGIPASLNTEFDYLTFEPSLRIAPFSGNFYLFLGPRLAFNDAHLFKFSAGAEQNDNTFSDAYAVRLSSQIGIGYDIPLALPNSPTQINLSPFIAFLPYFGSQPLNTGNLALSTIRAGIAIKIGAAHERPYPTAATTPLVEKDVQLSVVTPESVPSQKVVNENLPLSNAVFFDEGNTEIPNRYSLLTKEQAAGFKEAQLLDCQKNPGTRSERQLTVYYNILNILGDRMRNHPESTVKLIGSSAGAGEKTGEDNALSVKNYLVNNFGIDAGRIETEGRNMPLVPSEKYHNGNDIDLTKAEDNRVDIVSNSTDLLMETADNSAECAKKAEMNMDGSSPGDARIEIGTNALGTLMYWNIDVKDDSGNIQHFGPFGGDYGTISGSAILKDKQNGHYTIVLNGQSFLGHTITTESSFTLKSGNENAGQDNVTSIVFEFDKSKVVPTFQDFITNTVASLIPSNSTVVISGHTDIVGNEDHNMTLSVARANETQGLLKDAIDKEGKTGVTYKEEGYGVNNPLFDNSLPEQRFYNRTVVIEIIPSSTPLAIH